MDDRAEYRGHSFGRPIHLVIGATSNEAKRLLDLALDELERLESKFCSFRESSLLFQLNHSAGSRDGIALDEEAASLFNYASALWHSSGHRFDPTSCLLQPCYASGQADERIAAVAERVGWEYLELSQDSVRLAHPDCRIDLNNCVRPYAVDSLRRVLSRAGSSSAMVDLDRDVATIGRQPEGANWLAGLRLPRGQRSAITKLKLNHASLALRGDFERALMRDGQRYPRAFDPRDGSLIPAPLTVAVRAGTCLDACGAASLARLMPETEAFDWLNSVAVDWLAIDRQLACHGPIASELGAAASGR